MSFDTTRKKGNYLHVYLGNKKSRWLDYCQRCGEKPGVAVKQVICLLLSRDNNSSSRAEEAVGKADRSRRRIEIRLTESEFTTLDQIAELQGLTVNQLLVYLARAHVISKPQFNPIEVEALSESNFQILGIGRNLNQIARALNADDPDEHRPTIKDIKALSEKIYQHAHMVSNLIESNLERWKIK